MGIRAACTKEQPGSVEPARFVSDGAPKIHHVYTILRLIWMETDICLTVGVGLL